MTASAILARRWRPGAPPPDSLRLPQGLRRISPVIAAPVATLIENRSPSPLASAAGRGSPHHAVVHARKAPLLATLTVLCGVLALPAAAAAPGLAPSSKVVSYGPAAIGSTAVRWVTFTNRGSAPVLFGPVAVSWRGPAGFALQGGTCAEIVQLAGGASCSVGVAFSPRTAGSFRARLMYSADSFIAAVELRGRAG